jgi:hypothetical protein
MVLKTLKFYLNLAYLRQIARRSTGLADGLPVVGFHPGDPGSNDLEQVMELASVQTKVKSEFLSKQSKLLNETVELPLPAFGTSTISRSWPNSAIKTTFLNVET